MWIEHRNLLIDVVPKLLPQADFRNLIKAIAQTGILAEVPGNASYNEEVTFIVDAAIERRWVRALTSELAAKFVNREELVQIEKALEAEDLVPTTKEPFDEVLLGSDRPFVNRRPLRNALLNLVNPAGARVLLVDGSPQSGKTFSYYLLEHVATRRNFVVDKFEVRKLPEVLQLTEAVLRRLLAVVPALPEQGSESAERWAEKLAAIVASAVQSKTSTRFFIFDEFPLTSPPPETLSFISRLATFADQELRNVLRVVLVRFPGELAPEVDDVATRDDAQPFTVTDMVATMMQIARARGWDLTEATMRAKIEEFEALKSQSLRERFRFLRGLVLQLTAATRVIGAPA
ncbi:MAG: hypothetical protein ABI867_27270 [Kofleriaceae bacterium]